MHQTRVRAGIGVAILIVCAALGLAAEPASGAVAPEAVVAAAAADTGFAEPIAAPAGSPAATMPSGASTIGSSISAPPSGELTAQSILPLEANARDGRLGLILRNPAATPLAIAEIAIDEAMVTIGGEKSRLPRPQTIIACPHDPALKTAPFIVPPRHSCRIDIVLAPEPAGRHEARVTLTGAAGGLHTIRLQADIKRGPWTAITLIALGLLVGGLVTWWSGRGRADWGAAARVKSALEVLASQAAAMRAERPGSEARLAALTAGAADLQRRILTGEDTAPGEAAELARRVRFVNYLLLTERNARAGGSGSSTVDTAADTAFAALAPGPEGRFEPAIPETSIRELAEAITAARPGGIEAAEPTAAPPPGLPIDPAWSSSTLIRWQWLIEIAVALAMAIVFAAVALQSMYFNQPIWGSLADRIAAFIIGFGAYAGSVASVDAFIARAKTT